MSELTEPGITTGATAPTGTTTPTGLNDQFSQTTDQSDGPSSSAKDKAADTAQAGKQAASDVAQTATENAKNVAQETKAQARNIASEAKDQLKEQTGAQHKNLVKNLHSLADELGSMASNGDQSGVATDLVGKAGDRARTVASWLDDREPAQLVDELRSFARRRPGAFLAGALVAGVVAGRLTRGVAAAHSSDSDISSDSSDVPAVPAGSSGSSLGALPTGDPAYDPQHLPTSGTSYPSDTSAAYPPPLSSERIDEPGGGRW